MYRGHVDLFSDPLYQILQLYKDYIDPEFTWSNFTVEEQAKVIVAPRSNNLLDTARVRKGRGGRGRASRAHPRTAPGRILAFSLAPPVLRPVLPLSYPPLWGRPYPTRHHRSRASSRSCYPSASRSSSTCLSPTPKRCAAASRPTAVGQHPRGRPSTHPVLCGSQGRAPLA